MSEENMTPLAEFMAERQAQLIADSKEDDGFGAFSRLMLQMDTTGVADWIDAELNRGLHEEEIARALGNYIANLIAPLCIAKGQQALAAAAFVFGVAAESFEDMTTGEREVDAVLVHRKDGRQFVATTAGIVKKGMPE